MDKFVAEYLKTKGFTKALSVFENDMKERETSGMEQDPSRTSPFGEVADVIHQLFAANEKEGVDVDHYIEFRSWAFDSLDVIKPELLALLFPLFVKR